MGAEDKQPASKGTGQANYEVEGIKQENMLGRKVEYELDTKREAREA